MRGKKRDNKERHELFLALEGFLSMGFSLKKACSLADLPYSTIRDIISTYEPLRAKTRALQNTVNVKARENIINSIEQGNINDSKWWVERFDHTEPQDSPVFGGEKEAYQTVLETKIELETTPLEEEVQKMKNLLFN
jgi:hypothetical protein